jgi:hypothetical protein
MTQKLKHLQGVATAIIFGFALMPWTGLTDVRAQELSQGEGFNKGGRTALQFLKIGVGARQAAMGEASIAWVRDVNSIYWNPAATSGIESMEASFSYTRWLADLDYVAGAIGARWRRVGTFTLAVASLDYGQIPEAVVGSGGEGRTGNTFSGGDLMVGAAFSREFTDRLAIGIGVKWIRESLFEYSVSTVAYDVGSTYDLGWRGVRLSMAAQNFGGAVKWLGDASDRVEGYDLPLVFRIGMSTNLLGGSDSFFDAGPDHRIVVAAEAINTNDYSERLNLGAEYWFSNFMALRAGYRFNNDTGRWTVGAGLHPSVASLGLRIDYAYMSHEYLNAPHRFTVTMAF